uniref:Uncharacterized protein n=1 Tax=Leersia perrieri TaxID=77586 RepID=A0A0D9W0P1_9ORYZ
MALIRAQPTRFCSPRKAALPSPSLRTCAAARCLAVASGVLSSDSRDHYDGGGVGGGGEGGGAPPPRNQVI